MFAFNYFRPATARSSFSSRLATAMHGRRFFTVVVLIFTLVAPRLPPAADAVTAACNSSGGSYASGSAYEINLSRVAGALPTNASTSPELFATATVGTGANQTVYAIGLCRGDIAAYTCLVCLQSSFSDAQGFCPSDMDVSMDYDACHMRYSSTDFLAASTNNSVQQAVLSSFPAVPSSVAGTFNGFVAQLLNATAEYAAANSSTRFATGEMEVDSGYSQGKFSNIFDTAQCTPDLTPGQCRACLAGAMADMPSQVYPSNLPGAGLVGERCGFRFAPYQFYNGDIMVHLQVGEPRAGKKSNHTGIIVAIIIPSVVALAASMAMCLCCWRRRTKSKRSRLFGSHMDSMESIGSLLIDLPTLRLATNNFADNNKLGEGGFGSVYKGTLPSSQEIAVKRLSRSSRQGIGELKNELVLIANLQHKNLVRLVGVCLQEDEKLLIYEYLPNRSLDTFLFDSEKRKGLVWGTRFTIINGIARGLQYMHEDSQLKIVHRDLKASNVLLDADMKPKISDFGLARLFEGDQSQDTTIRVVGTYGYMAPEYALRGQYSIKSDIYSFGVLILEIITGRRNGDSYKYSDEPVGLPGLVWEHWTMKSIIEIVDPYLRSASSKDEILRCIHIGLSCVQEDPLDRPTISAISIMLDSNMVPSQALARPAFYVQMSGLIGSGAVMSPNELSITDPGPR